MVTYNNLVYTQAQKNMSTYEDKMVKHLFDEKVERTLDFIPPDNPLEYKHPMSYIHSLYMKMYELFGTPERKRKPIHFIKHK